MGALRTPFELRYVPASRLLPRCNRPFALEDISQRGACAGLIRIYNSSSTACVINIDPIVGRNDISLGRSCQEHTHSTLREDNRRLPSSIGPTTVNTAIRVHALTMPRGG